jgi:hypothetical protein
MLPMDKKQKMRTERDVIEEQNIQRGHFLRKLIPPFGSVKKLIIAPMHFISICHGKNQLSLKAKHLPSNSAM